MPLQSTNLFFFNLKLVEKVQNIIIAVMGLLPMSIHIRKFAIVFLKIAILSLHSIENA